MTATPHDAQPQSGAPEVTSLVAKLIKRLEEKGYSQGEIARQVGMNPSRLSRWVNGTHTDAADTALRIAAFASVAKPKRGSEYEKRKEAAASKP
jgi:transcriptional regulator with XRE-family HTH domain